mgnify:CR=1 FL=1
MPSTTLVSYLLHKEERIICGWTGCPQWATEFTHQGAGVSRINDKIVTVAALCPEHLELYRGDYYQTMASLGYPE